MFKATTNAVPATTAAMTAFPISTSSFPPDYRGPPGEPAPSGLQFPDGRGQNARSRTSLSRDQLAASCGRSSRLLTPDQCPASKRPEHTTSLNDGTRRARNNNPPNLSYVNPLNLVERYVVLDPVVELGRPRRFVPGDPRRGLDVPAVPHVHREELDVATRRPLVAGAKIAGTSAALDSALVV